MIDVAGPTWRGRRGGGGSMTWRWLCRRRRAGLACRWAFTPGGIHQQSTMTTTVGMVVKCDVAEFEPQVPNLAMAVQLLINYLINIYFHSPDSVPVHSGDHSPLNSGMASFHRNMLPPEWQYWQGPLPNFIPQESSGIPRNPRIPAGICGAS